MIRIIICSIFLIISSSCPSFADFKKEIIEKLQTINSLEFKFKQQSDEITEQGMCFMKFPGQMRCYYESEEGKEVLVTKNQMYIIKRKFERAYRYPIKNTQFTILLDKNKLEQNIIKIKDYHNSNNEIIFSINTNDGISVKVIFDKNNKILKGWETININQTKSAFEIINPKINTDIDEDFKVPNYKNL